MKSIICTTYEVLGICVRLRCLILGQIIIVRTCTPDIFVARSCFSGEFDEALSHVKNKHGLIIDAGSYIGTAAIVFAKRFPEAQIVCLEPSPDNFEICSLNTKSFKNIAVWNAALASKPGEQLLQARNTGAWGHTLVADPADCDRPTPIAKVNVVDIEQILSSFRFPSIEFLKLDIEGGELDLMSSNTNWINSTEVIFAEMHDRIVDGCSAAFKEANRERKIIAGSGRILLSIRAA